jgi:hypothetical protein
MTQLSALADKGIEIARPPDHERQGYTCEDNRDGLADAQPVREDTGWHQHNQVQQPEIGC